MEDVGVEGGSGFFGVEFGVTELVGLLLDSLLLIETRSKAFTVCMDEEFIINWNTLKCYFLHSYNKQWAPLLSANLLFTMCESNPVQDSEYSDA